MVSNREQYFWQIYTATVLRIMSRILGLDHLPGWLAWNSHKLRQKENMLLEFCGESEKSTYAHKNVK